MDWGAWWAAVRGVARSRTQLSDFTFPFHFHTLEKEMATHSSVLAGRIPGTGEPGGLPSMGSHRGRHEWSDLAVQETWIQPLGLEIPWRRKRQPTPVFLLGKSHGWRSLEGYSPWGRKELDMIEELTHRENTEPGAELSLFVHWYGIKSQRQSFGWSRKKIALLFCQAKGNTAGSCLQNRVPTWGRYCEILY